MSETLAIESYIAMAFGSMPARALGISAIFNTMRILKRVNPGDSYYEAYLGHLARNQEDFFDLYILAWIIGSRFSPRRILEVGSRTGISICQLLSSYIDPTKIEYAFCVDPLDDGFLSAALIRKNLRHLNLPDDAEKVKIIAGYSQKVLPSLLEDGRSFDYILVDGDHEKSTARLDLENAHSLLESGGFLLFDDISDAPGECALIDVWKEFQVNHATEYEFFTFMQGKGVGLGVKK